MDPLTMGLLGWAAIFVLVVLGMRIAFATALVGFMGIWIIKNMGVAGDVLRFLSHAIVAHCSGDKTLTARPLPVPRPGRDREARRYVDMQLFSMPY